MSDQRLLTLLASTAASDAVRVAGSVNAYARGGVVGVVSAPTEAQKSAGNYRKLHTTVHGMRIAIENPAGTDRTGMHNGKSWSVKMPAHYGYIKGTKGSDDDQVDVYLGPHPHHPYVHVIDQVDADTGTFDEHKAMVGYRTKKAALEHYHSSFSDGRGPDRTGAVTTLPIGKFKNWVAAGKRRAPVGLLRSAKINRADNVPYLAGASKTKSGLPVNIDSRVPKEITVKGKTFSPDPFLLVHELKEYSLMLTGMPYHKAHGIALKAERAAVERTGIDWKGYQEVMHKLAEKIEKLPHPRIPKYLYIKPYSHWEQHELDKQEAHEVRAFAAGGYVSGDPDDPIENEPDAVPSAPAAANQTSIQASGGWHDVDETGGWHDADEGNYGFVRKLAESVVPGAGALAGAGVGAEVGATLGALGGPAAFITAPAGGLVGGFAGAMAGGKAMGDIQDWFLDKLGLLDEAGRARYQEEHPIKSMTADFLAQGARPGPGGVMQRLGSAAMQAGFEAAQEGLSGQGLDVTRILEAGGAGAVLNRVSRAGEAISGAGTRAAGNALGRLPTPVQERIQAGKQNARDYWTGKSTDGQPGRPDQQPHSEPVSDWKDVENYGREEAPPVTPIEPEAIHPDYATEPQSERTPNENLAGQTRPGTAPPENVALAPQDMTFSPAAKTAEYLARSKSDAAPQRNTGGVLGTAVPQAAPDLSVDSVGSNPEHPLGVGSWRDYLASQGTSFNPSQFVRNYIARGESLDPSKGNISQEVQQAITGEPLVRGEEALEPTPREVTAPVTDDLNHQDPADKPNTPAAKKDQTTASVPFMITRAMKAQLAARGYLPDDIANMKPAAAQEILSKPALKPVSEAPRPVPTEEEGEAFNRAQGVQTGGPAGGDFGPEWNSITRLRQGAAGKEVTFRELANRLNMPLSEIQEAAIRAEREGKAKVSGGGIGLNASVRFTDETLRTQKTPETVQKPTRDVNAVINDLRGLGADRVADAVEAHPEKASEARALLDEYKGRRVLQDQESPRYIETPEETASAQGERVRQASGAITATESEARRINASRSAAEEAFAAHPPTSDIVPTTKDDIKATVARAKAIVDAFDAQAQHPDLAAARAELERNARPEWTDERKAAYIETQMKKLSQPATSADKSPGQLGINAARQLAEMKRPTLKRVQEFITAEKLLRSGSADLVKASNRVEGDVALNRRNVDIPTEEGTSGYGAVEEAGRLGASPEEELIRRQEEEALPDERLSEINEQAQLADNMAHMSHTADKAPTTELSDKGARAELQEKLAKAGGKTQAERDADAISEKIKAQKAARIAKQAEVFTRNQPAENTFAEMLKDESGKLDPQKVGDWLTNAAKPLKDFFVKNFAPEMFSTAARYADPAFAERNARYASEVSRIVKMLDGEWYAFNNLPKDHQVDFLMRFEASVQHPEQWMNDADDRFRTLLDKAYDLERRYGSTAEYHDNYMSHLFENDEAFKAFKEQMRVNVGPTWFQKQREFTTIREALNAGYKLQYTNPAEIVSQRLAASVDMTSKMHLLNTLQDMGMAHPIKETPTNAKRAEWQVISAPDRRVWVIAPDVQALWKNAVDAKGLWADKGALGSSFRAWMATKAVWVPIKLALSAFHPLHIVAGVAQADNFARGWQFTEGGAGTKFMAGLAEARKNLSDPLFAFDKRFLWFGPDVKTDFLGKQGRNALMVAEEDRTPLQREQAALLNKAGISGGMSEQERFNYKRAMAKAWADGNYMKWGTNRVFDALQRVSDPVFNQMIPNLKAASVLRTAAAYMNAHPEAATNPHEFDLAMRTIGKQVEERYGEMFYGGLFWNRYAKDTASGSFLSLGWNYGWARSHIGGLAELGERTARAVGAPLPERYGASRVVHDASSKAAYVASYTGAAMLVAGAMSYALSGEVPSDPMDWVFPRAGGQNPDGSPRRYSTMFFTREPVQIAKHIEAKNSVAGGLGQVLYNKMVIAPLVNAFQNRDYFGQQLYDPDAPWLTQWAQFAKSTASEMLNPIVREAGEKARLSGGGLRDQYLMPFLGFTPAPAYISRSPLQNRIAELYREGPGAAPRPYAARDTDTARREASADRAVAIKQGDKTAELAATKKLMDLGVSARSLKTEPYGAASQRQYAHLNPEVQKSLLGHMSQSDYDTYVKNNTAISFKGKDRIALMQEWERLHPTKPAALPSR